MSIAEYLESLSTHEQEEFGNEFKEYLIDQGEFIFEPLPASQIVETLIIQGFWSGTTYRYFYDPDTKRYYEQRKQYGR